MTELKREFFQIDPDVPVIFHRKEMVNRRPPFQALRDEAVREKFNGALLSKLVEWNYQVVSVVIDKLSHRDQYRVWRYHPYHYCLSVMLERYIRFLQDGDNLGDAMVESRGGKEDLKLKDSYRRLFTTGTDYVAANLWQERLTSSQIKVQPKKKDVAGLQLADIIAHPSRREILLDHHLIDDPRETFGDSICEVLRESKYLRSKSGKIEGYGKKLLP